MKKIEAIVLVLFSGILLAGISTMLFTGRKDGMQREMGIQVRMKKGNTIDGEQFVMGMAATELPRIREEEALKAWMIVCRTNFLKAAHSDKKLREEDLQLDYISPEQMESSNGKKVCLEYQSKLMEASEETFNKALYFGDDMIDALYHQVSTGRTISSEEIYNLAVPYLVSRESSSDVESDEYFNVKTLTYKECAVILKDQGTEISEKECRKYLTISEQTENGYVRTVTIKKNKWTGEEWKNIFNLTSPYFYLEPYEDRLRMISVGKGHGMGMSLYGANAMAQRGKKAEEILAWYYPKTEIRPVDTAKK